jgi:hypothetical protein
MGALRLKYVKGNNEQGMCLTWKDVTAHWDVRKVGVGGGGSYWGRNWNNKERTVRKRKEEWIINRGIAKVRNSDVDLSIIRECENNVKMNVNTYRSREEAGQTYPTLRVVINRLYKCQCQLRASSRVEKQQLCVRCDGKLTGCVRRTCQNKHDCYSGHNPSFWISRTLV